MGCLLNARLDVLAGVLDVVGGLGSLLQEVLYLLDLLLELGLLLVGLLKLRREL